MPDIRDQNMYSEYWLVRARHIRICYATVYIYIYAYHIKDDIAV